MTKIHLIVGLPGSGKTHYALSVLGHLPLVDDIREQDELLPDTQEFVIIDPNFCDEKILENAKQILTFFYPNAEFEIVYFENNPDACRANVARRDDGRNVTGTIERFAPLYNPPADALKVWTPDA